MRVLVTHPTGNRNVRAILEGFFAAEMLAEFHTTIAVDPSAKWINLFPAAIKNELLRRTFPIPKHLLQFHPFYELARNILPKLGGAKWVNGEKAFAGIYSVYKNLDNEVAKSLSGIRHTKGIDAVYAYEDGALLTFKKAKEMGLKCIYDLPIAYWQTSQKLLHEEAERLPLWSNTLGGIEDSTEKLERKTRELELADFVVGPGEFVISSLPEWATKKRTIISAFGSPETKVSGNFTNPEYESHQGKSGKPLKVLFVGSMSQRKGLADLFEAVKMLNTKDLELVVMGSLQAPRSFYTKQLDNFRYEAGRPHEEVLQLMRSCDVFCLPSIVEGRALVMQEAMSQGLPIIITPNTGGADLIKEGETGFLVPIRSPEKIAERLNWFLENRGKIPEMGRLAREHAAAYTWKKYSDKIINAI